MVLTPSLFQLHVHTTPMIDARCGLHHAIDAPSADELITLAVILDGGSLAGFLPAWRAYRRSVAYGMTVQV